MQLDEKSQPMMAYTIPGKGQYNWITSPMGLLGCPASFQRLMEGVMRNISNVIVYIDDLLVHTTTHEEHLKVLEQVLERQHSHNLKINLDKCFFGNKEVSWLHTDTSRHQSRKKQIKSNQKCKTTHRR
jgi:Reverse transcriptase (RNA-dependent DNA polymerase)